MLVFAFALLVGMIGAAILHELTHAAAVVIVGGEIRAISLRELAVQWALEEKEPLWKDRVIGLAPLGLGLLAGLTAFVLGLVPSGRAGIVIASGWAIFTLTGGLDDYRTGRETR